MPVSPVVLAGIAVSAQVGAALVRCSRGWACTRGEMVVPRVEHGILLLALIVVEPVIAVLITLDSGSSRRRVMVFQLPPPIRRVVTDVGLRTWVDGDECDRS